MNAYNYKNLFMYVCVAVIIVIFLITPLKRVTRETFIHNLSKYCGNCGYNNRMSCANCVDCGYCINKFKYGECLPGDAKGPYFRDDCLYWEYNSPLAYYYLYPYTHVFPIISIADYYPFPHYHY